MREGWGRGGRFNKGLDKVTWLASRSKSTSYDKDLGQGRFHRCFEKSNFHGVARTKIILLSFSLSFLLSFHEHRYVIFLGAVGVSDVSVKIPITLCR